MAIILPVRAPAPYLDETLASIRAQECPISVHIVIDGWNQDLVKKLDNQEGMNVRIHQVGKGVAAARNAALFSIQSEFCATIDADDIWPSDHLAASSEFLRSNSEVLMIGTSARLIDSAGKVIGHRKVKNGNRRRSLLFRNQAILSSSVFRTSALTQVGGWNTQTRVAADYELLLRLAVLGPVWNDVGRTIDYRIHGQQMSKTEIDELEFELVSESRRNLSRALGVPCIVSDVVSWLWKKHHELKQR